MSAGAPTASAQGRERPAGGGSCPVCGNGILFEIARTEAGSYLACFNCDTRGTVPTSGDWQPSVDAAVATPTGFQVTTEQLAAQRAVSDPEQAAARAHAAGAAESAATAADVAERDARIDELQRQLDEARANQQQGGQGGQQ